MWNQGKVSDRYVLLQTSKGHQAAGRVVLHSCSRAEIYSCSGWTFTDFQEKYFQLSEFLWGSMEENMVLQDQPLNHLPSIQFYTVLTVQITSRWGNGVAVPFLQPVLPSVETCSAHALLLEQMTGFAVLSLRPALDVVCSVTKCRRSCFLWGGTMKLWYCLMFKLSGI